MTFTLPEGWSLEPPSAAPTMPAFPSDNEVGAYITQAAQARGIDPSVALKVWGSEGKGAWQSNFVKNGVREPSYGPYQLYMGGGLGNEFQQATGLDPSDPSTWKQGVDFALDKAKEGGWGPWYGAKRVGITGRMGIGDDTLQGSSGTDVMASSSGFQLPEGWSVEPPQPAGDFRMENKFEMQDAPVTASGLAKSFGSRAQRAVAGMAGLPGDVRSLAAKGIEGATGVELPTMPNWIPSQIGGIPTGSKTTEQIQGGLERSGMPVYDPQNTAEEYAGTLGDFAPAVFGGGASLLRRGAQAVIPALASETGGQIAREVAPEWETPIRVGTALAASPAGARASIKKPPIFKPETAAKLRAEAKLAFMEAEQLGQKIDGQRVQAMVAALERRVTGEGFDAALHPRASGALTRLKGEADEFKQKPAPAMAAITGTKAAQAKQGLPLTEAQTIRRILSSAARSPDKDERRLAGMMIEALDDLVDSYGGQKWAKARALYHKYSKAQQIEDMLENAGIRSGQFSVSGMENAVRTEFRQLYRKIIKDGRERARWTPQQRKLIKKLGNMGGMVNILRVIGKLSPRSQLMLSGGLIGGGVSYGSNDPTAAGIAGVGWGLGAAGQLAALGLTKRKVNQLRANVTGSAPMPTVPGTLGVTQNPLGAFLLGNSATLPARQ